MLKEAYKTRVLQESQLAAAWTRTTVGVQIRTSIARQILLHVTPKKYINRQ
jgi:hypothetical protein